MIYMTHNTYNRWSWNHILLVFLVLLKKLLDNVNLLFFLCYTVILKSDL